MSAFFFILTLLLQPARALGIVPPPLQAVLDRHALPPEGLPPLGLVADQGKILRLDSTGKGAEPALTPEELEAWLARRAEAAAPPAGAWASRVGPVAVPQLDFSLGAPAPAAPQTVFPPAPLPPQLPRRPWVEPEFAEDWKSIAKDLWSAKNFKRGLMALAARSGKDEAAETGLCEGAGEALRLLTLAVHEGKGGSQAAAELRRLLTRIANLSTPQKLAFAPQVVSPLTAYVALSRSRAPHSLDARLYFERMTSLLDANGMTMTEFIREIDSKLNHAGEFLLKAHAYDALLPYLNRKPAEAAALAPMLFPEGRPKEIRANASPLEGLMTQLAAQGKKSGALDRFIQGLEEHAVAVPGKTASRVAAYLAVNEEILPGRLVPAVRRLEGLLPEDLLDEAGLTPPDPHDQWPKDQWNFVLHFASTESYSGFFARFRARGYKLEPSPHGVAAVKKFGGLKISLVAKLYPGDKDGFLRGQVAQEFLHDVEKNLRDPAVQGVILRNHAQFRIVNLFGKGVTPGKMLIDGSCRSALDLRKLRAKCPTCHFIVNTGTGRGPITSEAIVAVVEGLARGEDWTDIWDEWSAQSPRSAARMQGPWTPPFGEALDLLEKSEKNYKKQLHK